MIVGGSQGLGRAIARQAQQRGCSAHVWSRQSPRLTGIEWTPLDLRELPNLDELTFPDNVDTIFHTAAVGSYFSRVEDYSPVSFTSLLAVNLVAMATVLFAALLKLPRGGRYCYVSSLTALLPAGPWCLYGASKSGADQLVRSLRKSAAERDISLTLAYPGILRTGFHARLGRETPAEAANPEAIADDIIDAVEARKGAYVAPMDRGLIDPDGDLRQRESRADTFFPPIRSIP